MKHTEEYNDLKGFVLEGSVLVAWKKVAGDKREFIGLYIADENETMEGILEENKLDENPIKHNVLVPVFMMENLLDVEKRKLIVENLKNEIWDWDADYDFEEAAETVF